MRALVVFESMFGNSKAIGEAVAEGLATQMDVQLVDVASAPTSIDDQVDLLIVGGPTHAFGLSRESTRRSAIDQGAEEATLSCGLREWLDALSPPPSRTKAASFDTRVNRPRLAGSAARAAARRLRRLGYQLIARSESFYVGGVPGPLAEGERERAFGWARRLGSAASDAPGQPSHQSGC